MKIAGIIFLVLGIISTLGAFIGAVNGYKTSFSSIAFIVLGAFLVNRANKKKEEEEKKKKWVEGGKESE